MFQWFKPNELRQIEQYLNLVRISDREIVNQYSFTDEEIGKIYGENAVALFHQVQNLYHGRIRRLGDPAIMHPADMTKLLRNELGFTDIYIHTALTHDTIEDCVTCPDDLPEKYEELRKILSPNYSDGYLDELMRNTKVLTNEREVILQGVKKYDDGEVAIRKILDRHDKAHPVLCSLRKRCKSIPMLTPIYETMKTTIKELYRKYGKINYNQLAFVLYTEYFEDILVDAIERNPDQFYDPVFIVKMVDIIDNIRTFDRSGKKDFVKKLSELDYMFRRSNEVLQQTGQRLGQDSISMAQKIKEYAIFVTLEQLEERLDTFQKRREGKIDSRKKKIMIDYLMKKIYDVSCHSNSEDTGVIVSKYASHKISDVDEYDLSKMESIETPLNNAVLSLRRLNFTKSRKQLEKDIKIENETKLTKKPKQSIWTRKIL
ncbi:MAG: hypothetical protein V1870_05315 [Candidatus Aenigmatarchaeota archaeon]